jgi:hypothetical protein
MVLLKVTVTVLAAWLEQELEFSNGNVVDIIDGGIVEVALWCLDLRLVISMLAEDVDVADKTALYKELIDIDVAGSEVDSSSSSPS